MSDPILIQMRLESVLGKPVEEFQLPEVTYDALAFQAVCLAQSTRDPSKPINLLEYSIVLKYQNEGIRDDTWWVRIRSTEQLVRVVDGARDVGYLRVTADVLNLKPAAALVSRAAISRKNSSRKASAELELAAADAFPDAPTSASLPTSRKRVATGELTDVGSPKRASAPSTVEVTPGEVTDAGPPERASARSTMPVVTPTTSTHEVEPQKADDKILAALSFFDSLRITSPPKIQVALMSNYSNIKSAGFARAVSRLKQQNLICCGSGTMSLTTNGKEGMTMMPNPPTDNEDVHRRFKTLLTPTCASMFDLLADGRAHKKSDLMMALNYTNEKSAGFTNSLSSMFELGLITKEQKVGPGGSKTTLIRLTDLAFPFGRPQGSSSGAKPKISQSLDSSGDTNEDE